MTNIITKRFIIEHNDFEKIRDLLYRTWEEENFIFLWEENFEEFAGRLTINAEPEIFKNEKMEYLMLHINFWRLH